MNNDLWPLVWLMLGSLGLALYLLRSELQEACSRGGAGAGATGDKASTEGMAGISSAYAPPKDLPLTRSSMPGTLVGYDPLQNMVAPFEAAAPTPAPAPLGLAFPATTR